MDSLSRDTCAGVGVVDRSVRLVPSENGPALRGDLGIRGGRVASLCRARSCGPGLGPGAVGTQLRALPEVPLARAVLPGSPLGATIPTTVMATAIGSAWIGWTPGGQAIAAVSRGLPAGFGGARHGR